MRPQTSLARLFAAAVLWSAVPVLPLWSSAPLAQTQPSPSTPLLQIEGVLEDGGTRLEEDDTLYATHEFEGEAGQIVTIVMESLEFNTYLFLIDPQGEVIAQNNDYADGNVNSVITIELPVDGTYTIVANAYAAQQRGQYTLTVLPGEDPVFSDVALQQAEARLLNQQGVQHYRVSEYQAALESFQQALIIFQEIRDRAGEGTTLNNIGGIYDRLGDYGTALEYYERALAIRQEIRDRAGEGTTLNNIGAIYRSLGDYGTALAYYERALAIRQEIRDRAGEGTTLNNIGGIYDRLGDYGTALAYYERALAIRQEIRDRAGEGTTLNNIGGIYDRLGDYGTALAYYERALAIRQEIRDRAGEGTTLNNIGGIYDRLGDYGTALEYYERALAIRQEIRDRAGEGTTLNNIGSVYRSLGDYGTALAYYERALAIRQEIRDRAGEGTTLNNIGAIYRSLGDYGTALAYYERALAIRQEIRDRAGEGTTLNNIGGIYDRLGDYGTALAYYERALAIRQEIRDRAGEGTTLNNIGGIYDRLGDYGTALAYYERALAIRQEIRDRAGEGTTLNNIGLVYDRLGDYGTALEYYERALAILQEIRDRAGEGTTLNNIGLVYDRLGDYGTALEYYERALAILQEIRDRAGEGTTLNNIGLVYNRLGDYGTALEYYERALAILQEIRDRAGEGTTLNNIGAIYRSLGDYGTALEYYERALAIRQEIRDRAGEGTTLNNIGGIYDRLGDYGTALEYYERALAIRQEIRDRYGIASTLHNMGYAIEALEEPELAIVFLKASVNQWEEIRGDIRGLDVQQQQSFTDSISGSYRKLADLLLQNDRILEAQRVLDLLKVQELDEYLENVRGNAETASGVELLNPEIEISNRAIAIGYELAQLRDIPFAELTDEQKERIAELQAEQDLIRDDFKAFIDSPDIQALIAQLSTDAKTQDMLARMEEFKNLQNNLQQLPNAVMIYPLILEDRLELVVVPAFGEPTRYPVAVERDELNQAIVDFRQALTTRSRDPKPAAQKLYDLLIAPMAADLEAIGAETILYAPDGVLRYIPLAALHDGDQWLIERFRINNITAASLQDFTLQPDSQPQILAAAFSEGLYEFEVGQRNFSLGGLPYAGVEVENLVAAFPGTTPFFNETFTLPDTELAMDSHTIVHLATHAAFVQGSPSDSFILFGNGDRLTLEYIKENWDGKFNRVDLVVLSACETGLGDILQGNGEEILGFGYLMQQAGAEAAIASLWSVNDGGTQVLMNAFYSALNQGMSKAEALRQAQIALITGDFSAVGDPRGEDGDIVFVNPETDLPVVVSNNLDHPYYWAPFILIGNGL